MATQTQLEIVLDMWKADAVMDQNSPQLELLRIPQLHAKYVEILYKHSALKKIAERNLAVATKQKWDYYSGKMDQEELQRLGLAPFKFVLKGEVAAYVAADSQILDLTMKRDYHDDVMSLCSSIMKELNSRTYQLRSYIDFEKFVGGQ